MAPLVRVLMVIAFGFVTVVDVSAGRPIRVDLNSFDKTGEEWSQPAELDFSTPGSALYGGFTLNFSGQPRNHSDFAWKFQNNYLSFSPAYYLGVESNISNTVDVVPLYFDVSRGSWSWTRGTVSTGVVDLEPDGFGVYRRNQARSALQFTWFGVDPEGDPIAAQMVIIDASFIDYSTGQIFRHGDFRVQLNYGYPPAEGMSDPDFPDGGRQLLRIGSDPTLNGEQLRPVTDFWFLDGSLYSVARDGPEPTDDPDPGPRSVSEPPTWWALPLVFVWLVRRLRRFR